MQSPVDRSDRCGQALGTPSPDVAIRKRQWSPCARREGSRGCAACSITRGKRMREIIEGMSKRRSKEYWRYGTRPKLGSDGTSALSAPQAAVLQEEPRLSQRTEVARPVSSLHHFFIRDERPVVAFLSSSSRRCASNCRCSLIWPRANLASMRWAGSLPLARYSSWMRSSF
jgi:hypothetical protein